MTKNSSSTDQCQQFEAYYDEFQSLTERIQQGLYHSSSSSSTKQQQQQQQQEEEKNINVMASSSSLDFLLGQCNDLWKQMSTEARSIIHNEKDDDDDDDDATRQQELLMKAQVQRCKSQLAALKQDYERQQVLLSSSSPSSDETTTTGTAAAAAAVADSRSRNRRRSHQRQDEVVHIQQGRLDRARLTLAETEVVASDISSQLAMNREILDRSQTNANHFSNLVDTASLLVQRMSKRRGIRD